jgi:hypothetical protein
MRSSLLLCAALLTGCSSSPNHERWETETLVIPTWYSDLAWYKRLHPARYVIGFGAAEAETDAWAAARQDARSKIDPGERLDDESFFFLNPHGERIPAFDDRWSSDGKIVMLFRVLPAPAPVAAAAATVDVTRYVLLMATEGEEPGANALLVEAPDGVQHNLWVGARLDGRTIREIRLKGDDAARAVDLTLEDAAGARETVSLRRRS